MDLIKEFKTAVKNPVNFKNFYIIFANLFLVLIIGLSMLSIGRIVLGTFSTNTACDKTTNLPISGTTSRTKEATYTITYSGNDKCFLENWITWPTATKTLAVWLYDPGGTVTILNSINYQPYITYFTNTPLKKGAWQLKVRTLSETPVKFSGEIGIR